MCKNLVWSQFKLGLVSPSGGQPCPLTCPLVKLGTLPTLTKETKPKLILDLKIKKHWFEQKECNLGDTDLGSNLNCIPWRQKGGHLLAKVPTQVPNFMQMRFPNCMGLIARYRCKQGYNLCSSVRTGQVSVHWWRDKTLPGFPAGLVSPSQLKQARYSVGKLNLKLSPWTRSLRGAPVSERLLDCCYPENLSLCWSHGESSQ